MRPRNASAFTLSRVGMHRASLGGFISAKWCTPRDGGRQRVLRFRLGSFLPLGVCFSHFSAIFGCFACIHRLWAWDLNGMACLRCKGRRPPTSQEAEADGVAVVPPGYEPGEASICALALPPSAAPPPPPPGAGPGDPPCSSPPPPPPPPPPAPGGGGEGGGLPPPPGGPQGAADWGK